MTPDERDIIGQFVTRVSGTQVATFAGGSVPATRPALPPVDPEADRFLAELFSRFPEARYRITQTAFVHEAALAEAQTRIQALQAELAQLRQALNTQAAQPRSGGFFGGLFGGGQRTPAPGYPQAYPPQAYPPQAYPPQAYPPQAYPTAYPPSYQPGMFSGGSGFLGSALTTAAGVAGGVLAADAISSMFHHNTGFGGGLPGGSPWGGGTTINETVYNNAPADPWAGAGTSGDPGWATDTSSDSSANDGGGDWSGGGDDGGGSDDFV